MSINILHKDTGKVLFTVNADTLKGADLSGANLSGANLSRDYLCYADLSGANLSGADLSGADLFGVDLSGANLHSANLYSANLYSANLYSANLSGANLSRSELSYANLYNANLSYANLSGADLFGADLSGANLSGANLRGAVNIPEIVAARLSIVPEEGSSYIGWKKCKKGTIVKLLIFGMAKRSNATTRKCRAEYAKVLAVFSKDGTNYGVSMHDSCVKYYVGETVHCDVWDEDRWNECSGGIHHFITRAEAEAY